MRVSRSRGPMVASVVGARAAGVGSGGVTEWLMVADCKSAGLCPT